MTNVSQEFYPQHGSENQPALSQADPTVCTQLLPSGTDITSGSVRGRWDETGVGHYGMADLGLEPFRMSHDGR